MIRTGVRIPDHCTVRAAVRGAPSSERLLTVCSQTTWIRPLETWDPILDKVAAFAPVVAYDRSGTAQSPWDGQPPTPQRANQRLKKLLETLGVPSPTILVGHSWGGVLARYFAGEYGATATDLDAVFASMEASTNSAPPAVRAESLMLMDLR